MHTTLYVCECVFVTVWFVNVWVSSNITSVNDEHTHTSMHTSGHSHILTDLYTKTGSNLTDQHRSSTPYSKDVSCKSKALRENSLDKLQMHIHTCRQTHTRTTEHFKPTMLTLCCFPKPVYLHAGQGKHHRESTWRKLSDFVQKLDLNQNLKPNMIIFSG